MQYIVKQRLTKWEARLTVFASDFNGVLFSKAAHLPRISHFSGLLVVALFV